jgi:hypothetical protein
MGKVIAGINAPGSAGARMARVQDTVEHRVAQIDVAGRHIDLGPQHPRPVRELARPHAAEQIEVFLDGSVAPGTIVTRLGQRAAGEAHFFLRLVVDIGLAGTDQVLGPLVELLEVVRCVIEMGSPVEAEPAHIVLDGVDVFLLLLRRIGVVEAQVTAATELLRNAEVQGNRLGVADMQIAVGLWRKAGHHRGVALGGEIRLDDIADEIPPHLHYRRSSCRHAASIPLSMPRPMCQIRGHAPRPSARETFNDPTYFCATRSPLTTDLALQAAKASCASISGRRGLSEADRPKDHPT